MTETAGRDAPRVDEANQCIWRGDRRVELLPKTFLVLRRLMQQPNQIVSKDELLQAAWPDTHVMDGVLKVAINRLRDALEDDSQQPRFIETVHRRGYRWIGSALAPAASPQTTSDLPPFPPTAPHVVGRDSVLEQLGLALARATAGSRQTVFVTGDPGIGKTTVLDAFVAQLGAARASESIVLAQGQCVDGYGTSDAYMPLLQALAQLCRESHDGETTGLLRRFAPTWLIQLPQLIDADEQDELRRSLAGSTGDRMVRDLVFFVEALTARHTLVLLLEDVHWSDHATVGALAALAARREPARLMIVASYRTVDAIALLHPITRLRKELAGKRQCQQIALEGLETEAVDALLADRFPDCRLPPKLSAVLHDQTSGNPLFILNAMEELIRRERLKERGGVWECTIDLATLASAVPETTRELIGSRLDQLSGSDLELLEAASVVGPIFPTQALAVMLDREPSAVEIDCDRLARTTQFLREGDTVDWLDGRTGVQHFFRHALYLQVLYSRVTPARRRLLHLRFAECLEKGFAAEAGTLTSLLAHHFERGGDRKRAVKYRRKSAYRAVDRFAYPQAIDHLRAGLAILRDMPASAERDSEELKLQVSLLTPLYVVGGVGKELDEVVHRIDTLSGDGDPADLQLFGALATLAATLCKRGEIRAARSITERLVEKTHGAGEILETVAKGIRAFCQVMQGEIVVGVQALERSSELSDMPGPMDPGTTATIDLAVGWLLLGRPLQARERVAEATRRVSVTKRPSDMLHVALGGICIGIVLVADDLVEEHAAALVRVANRFNRDWLGWAEIGEGLVELHRGRYEGADRITRARQELLQTGMCGYESLFTAVAASALMRVGRHDEGGALLEEVLQRIDETGERWYEPELLRLEGELRMRRAASGDDATKQLLAQGAESFFRRSLDIASLQGATWWELRSSVSLARLLAECGRRDEASALLTEAYGRFSEGFDLPDLRDARSLMESLAG